MDTMFCPTCKTDTLWIQVSSVSVITKHGTSKVVVFRCNSCSNRIKQESEVKNADVQYFEEA